MSKQKDLQVLTEEFYLYVSEWKKLDKFRLNWWFKYPLFPIGFILQEINLRKKHTLTTAYAEILDKYKIK